MNKTLTKALVLMLGLLLLLPLGLWTLYYQRQALLEYAISHYSDYRLSSGNDVGIDLIGRCVDLRFSDLQLHSGVDGTSLLRAGDLEIKACLDILSLSADKVLSISASDLQVLVVRQADGDYNWPLGTDDGEDSWLFDTLELANLDIKRLSLELQGFAADKSLISLAELSLHNEDETGHLQLEGLLNGYPIIMQAELESTRAFLNTDDSMRMNLSARVDDFSLAIVGTYGTAPGQTHLQLRASAESLAALSTLWRSPRLPKPRATAEQAAQGGSIVSRTALDSSVLSAYSRLQASALLQNPAGHFDLDQLELELAGNIIDLRLSGKVVAIDEFESGGNVEARLALKALVPDVGALADLPAISRWQGWRLKLSSNLLYDNSTLQLQAFRFSTGRPWSATELSPNDLPDRKFPRAEQRSLDVGAETLTLSLSPQEQGLALHKATLGYQYSEQQHASHFWRYDYLIDTAKLQLSGDPDTDFALHLDSEGQYNGLPLSVAASWQTGGKFRIDSQLAEGGLTLSGVARADSFNASAKLNLDTLRALARLLNLPALALDEADITASINSADGQPELQDLKLSFSRGDSRIRLTGQARQLEPFDNYTFDVGLQDPSLADLNQWLEQLSPAIERSLQRLLELRSYATLEGGRPLPVAEAPTSWLQEPVAALELAGWIEDYPALDAAADVRLRIEGQQDRQLIDMPEVRLDSPLVTLRWTGRIESSAENFLLQGDLDAQLQQGAIEHIATPVNATLHVEQQDNGPLRLQNIRVTAGLSRFSADLDLQRSTGLDAVSGHIDFARLDLLPYFPRQEEDQPKSDPRTLAAAGQKDAKSAEKRSFYDLTRGSRKPDKPMFSADSFEFDWLPDYRLDLDLGIEEFNLPWFEANAVTLKVKRDDDGVLFDNISARIGKAPVSGSFRIEHEKAEPTFALRLRTDGLDPDQVVLLRGYDFIQRGSFNALLELRGRGSNAQQLASTLSGRVTLMGRDIQPNSDDLEKLAPEVLTELNKRINPFARKNGKGDSRIECGLIHFNVKDGVMIADKSIVLVTPRMILGVHGAVDLGQEKLRLQFIPQMRTGLGISLRGSVARMAVLTGYIQDPVIEIDPKGALASGGRDVAGTLLYGPLYWLYLGQAQKLLASPKVCERAIATYAPEFASEPPAKATKRQHSVK